MPAPQLHGDGDFSSPEQKSIPLPSFYSPRTSASGPDMDADLNGTFSLKNGRTSPVTGRPQEQAESIAEIHPESSALPSSLISPTPSSPLDTAEEEAGTSRPENALQVRPELRTATEPRGVPVDSSDPSGGCGSKKPHLLETLPRVECIVRARIPTVTGNQMFLHLYSNNVDNKEHLAIVFGDQIRSKSLDAPRPGETERDRMTRGAYTGVLYPGRTSSGMVDSAAAKASASPIPSNESNSPPLVRVHSECYTGETVWSARCDCGEQLDEAARLMSLPGNKSGGVIIYLRQEGRGIGLGEKLKAYNLQDLGSDTVEANLLLRHPADARSYGLATAMLLDLGQQEIRLLTNNPDKIRAVEGPNREIVVKERVPMVPLSWRGQGGFRSQEVDGYLSTKIKKMGHLLDSGAVF